MESVKEKSNKRDLLHGAVDQLLKHKMMDNGRRRDGPVEECSDQEESRLLSNLLSQLESLDEDAHTTYSTKCGAVPDVGIEEIARELRAVKRQNLTTHCLLVVMIVLTGAWQISEVSLLLSMKEKLCNPLKSVVSFIGNSIKGRGKKFEIEGPVLPPVVLPQIPCINLPSLPSNGKEQP